MLDMKMQQSFTSVTCAVISNQAKLLITASSCFLEQKFEAKGGVKF